MSTACGNQTSNTGFFPVRLPHDLRAALDRAHELTGQPRSQILIAGAWIQLEKLNLLNNAGQVEGKPPGPSSN